IPVVFTNTSSGTGLTYLWNFNDPSSGSSNTSTQTNPQHYFISNVIGCGTAPSFNVSLISTNIYGCKDTAHNNVSVKQVPSDSLFSNTLPPFSQCNNHDTLNLTVTYYGTQCSNAKDTIIWGN